MAAVLVEKQAHGELKDGGLWRKDKQIKDISEAQTLLPGYLTLAPAYYMQGWVKCLYFSSQFRTDVV